MGCGADWEGDHPGISHPGDRSDETVVGTRRHIEPRSGEFRSSVVQHGHFGRLEEHRPHGKRLGRDGVEGVGEDHGSCDWLERGHNFSGVHEVSTEGAGASHGRKRRIGIPQPCAQDATSGSPSAWKPTGELIRPTWALWPQ